MQSTRSLYGRNAIASILESRVADKNMIYIYDVHYF